MGIESLARVSERTTVNPAFYRSNLHLVTPDMINVRNVSSIGPRSASPADITAEKMVRKQILRLDVLDARAAIKLDPLAVLRINNSFCSCHGISELMEKTVAQLGYHFNALVDFELRADLLDEKPVDLPLHQLMPNLLGKNPVKIEKMIATREPLVTTGSDGEHLIIVPLFDDNHVFLGGIQFRSFANYSTEEREMIREFCVTINETLKRMIEIEKLKMQAVTDGLTGLYNRRYFEEFIKNQFAAAKRNGKELGLLVIDLDHFKQINDTYGHQAGDKVLRAVSLTIRNTVRAMDLAARYGGEEMAVVIPETGEAGSRILAEKIRSAIAALKIDYNGQLIKVTASIGVGQYSQSMGSEELLVKQADLNVYQAKKDGRNKVVF